MSWKEVRYASESHQDQGKRLAAPVQAVWLLNVLGTNPGRLGEGSLLADCRFLHILSVSSEVICISPSFPLPLGEDGMEKGAGRIAELKIFPLRKTYLGKSWLSSQVTG